MTRGIMPPRSQNENRWPVRQLVCPGLAVRGVLPVVAIPPNLPHAVASESTATRSMAAPFQPALFEPPQAVPSIGERLRDLALIANGACIDTAHAVAATAASAWWRARVRMAGGDSDRLLAPAAPVPRIDMPPLPRQQARELGAALAGLPVTEANALLGRLYTQALPDEYRVANGIFYTPPSLVARLLDRTEAAGHDWTAARVIDPACGAGAFLVQAAERMLSRLPDADPAITLANIGTRLRGWEIDPFAAWLAQLAVESVLLPHTVASGRRLGPVVEVTDALAAFAGTSGRWRLVMGNPPFGKVKDTPTLRARFRRSLYGHPNLYGLFLDAAVHLADPERGLVAFLTPASFLAGQYFRNLRMLLHEHAPPASLDLVEARSDVFDDVLQEVALSVFQRGRAPAPAPCAVVRISRCGMQVEATGSLVLPADPREPWTLPRCAADAALVSRMHVMPARLADWGYEVCTGPLVWNRHKPRLHDTARPGCVPVVWAEAVTPDGRFVLRATRRNHRAWYQPGSAPDPNLVNLPCVLIQRTTAKEQSRRLIGAVMPASVFGEFPAVAVENHLNMVRPAGRRPKVPIRVVARFFASEAADRVLRCMNGSVAVSASELAAMPLPGAAEILAAAGQDDFEAELQRLYGVGAA